MFKTALENTLEATLPHINNTVAENQDGGDPVDENGHSAIEALLALEDN